MANLQQVTREKREYLLTSGDLRQEVKKHEGYLKEQRVRKNLKKMWALDLFLNYNRTISQPD